MEELFHVSDQPGITRFEPRPPPPGNTTHTGRMVWAVGQRLLHNYLVPRDCPRVTFYAGPQDYCRGRRALFRHHYCPPCGGY